MEEINWMMRIPWYIVIGALVCAYWQKSNKDVPFGKRYILKEAYWKWYILRTYPPAHSTCELRLASLSLLSLMSFFRAFFETSVDGSMNELKSSTDSDVTLSSAPQQKGRSP